MTEHESYTNSAIRRGGIGNSMNASLTEQVQRRKLSHLAGNAAMSLGLNSPKGLSSPTNLDHMPAFTVSASKGIPDKANIRTESASRNRIDSLMRMPQHKSGTTKFDSTSHMRTIAPLTSEDIGQFHNLGLMSTLRSTQPSVTNQRHKSVAIDNPPSFYEADLKKKQDKYQKAI